MVFADAKLAVENLYGAINGNATVTPPQTQSSGITTHAYLSGVTYQSPGPKQYQVTVLCRLPINQISVSNDKFAELAERCDEVIDALNRWEYRDSWRVLDWPVTFQSKAAHVDGQQVIQAEANILIGTDLYE